MGETADERLSWIIRNGEMDALKELDFDPNCTDKGTPILVVATDYGHVDVMKYLIEKGADVNKSNSAGITPILVAIWEENYEAVQLLLQKGAKKNGKSPDGTSYSDLAPTEIKALLKG
ncbi:myotrophin homolog [Clavelina lepadiformis]|uniref:Myotrophin n=1 Tax=Clavelina lepadiformis TaxID=159417 RepID=A0ABP0FVB8_CLALP